MNENTKYLRGQVWFYKTKNNTTHGQIQNANRPVIIVSNDVGNAHAPICTVVPCTTAKKNRLPTHARVFLRSSSTAMCEQVLTVNKSDLVEYMRTLSCNEMAAIDYSLRIAMGFAPVPVATRKTPLSA